MRLTTTPAKRVAPLGMSRDEHDRHTGEMTGCALERQRHRNAIWTAAQLPVRSRPSAGRGQPAIPAVGEAEVGAAATTGHRPAQVAEGALLRSESAVAPVRRGRLPHRSQEWATPSTQWEASDLTSTSNPPSKVKAPPAATLRTTERPETLFATKA